MSDDDLLSEGKEAFALAKESENDNRLTYEQDLRFGRHEEQWPDKIRAQREREGRPCLTINKLTSFTRQVVNDARQNKPSIKVHPADSGADPETAEVMNDLIRNIEYSSSADVAYDTAVDCAVNGGWGYLRVGLDYAYHDSFDMDLTIDRVANPLSVYGDPRSTAADSSDWMDAFAVDRFSKDQFKAKYGETKTLTDWEEASDWDHAETDDDDILVAEWWHREEQDVAIAQFLNKVTGGLQTYTKDDLEKSEDLQLALQKGMLEFRRERVGKSYKVEQRIMTGAEIVKTNKWAGCYIPIIPVYGDEYNIKGKRYFRSLIHPALDAQRQFNYWRTAATELVALAPKTPWIGRKGTFNSDIERWNTANTKSHPFLEFDGEPPMRQPLDVGPAAGALQEALNASDDMKATIGLYDASLGARSNETSGKAILARQREGDVSTFHFIDNMSRAIRHTGRVLLDLIPHVYSGERVIRVMGEDGKPRNVQLGKQTPKLDPKTGQPVMQEQQEPNGETTLQPVLALHDFAKGKYDLTVTTGPSFTTRREEAAYSMTEALRAFPQAAPVIVPELAKNLDWPGADDIAEKLEQQASGQLPPEVQKMVEMGKQQIAQLTEENQQLKQDHSLDAAKLQQQQQAASVEAQNKVRIALIQIEADKQIAFAKIEAQKEIDAYKATITAQAQAMRPVPAQAA